MPQKPDQTEEESSAEEGTTSSREEAFQQYSHWEQAAQGGHSLLWWDREHGMLVAWFFNQYTRR